MRAAGAHRRDDDPGVPDALPEVLGEVARRLDVGWIDRVWIFPPLRSGRRERGLLAVSLDVAEGGRRRLVTVSWAAERSGLERTLTSSFTEEGDAPPELLPRVMRGVARRAGEDHEDAREVPVDGDPERFAELVREVTPVEEPIEVP